MKTNRKVSLRIRRSTVSSLNSQNITGGTSGGRTILHPCGQSDGCTSVAPDVCKVNCGSNV